MIVSNTSWQSGEVAQHYDELDTLYREVWGEHLHHGFWRHRFWQAGYVPVEEAVLALLDRVAEGARLEPGVSVCDVGCGYGGTARWLAATYGAQVTGLTLSPTQYTYARAQPARPQPRYLLHDWLTNPLPDASFDVLLALESTEHMSDLTRCFAQAYRVLRPGGRVVICAWLAAETAKPWEVRHLLEPICREGRLAGLGTMSEYRQGLSGAGFVLTEADDITRHVRHTWTVIIARVLRGLATRRRYWRYLLDPQKQERPFARSLLRMWLGYRTGALRYGLISAYKPG